MKLLSKDRIKNKHTFIHTHTHIKFKKKDKQQQNRKSTIEKQVSRNKQTTTITKNIYDNGLSEIL